jgi:flagellar biosynthetic protein FliQ
MPMEQIVGLGQKSLMEVLLLAGPILGVAITISLLVNIVQVLTSLQEVTISTVPRLLASAAALFFLMPWMWRHLGQFTVQMLSDFRIYVR